MKTFKCSVCGCTDSSEHMFITNVGDECDGDIFVLMCSDCHDEDRLPAEMCEDCPLCNHREHCDDCGAMPHEREDLEDDIPVGKNKDICPDCGSKLNAFGLCPEYLIGIGATDDLYE
jgi:hypothetical protein